MRRKAGVFYQHAGGAAERSDETDPSSASSAGSHRYPGTESCTAVPFVLGSRKIVCLEAKLCSHQIKRGP